MRARSLLLGFIATSTAIVACSSAKHGDGFAETPDGGVDSGSAPLVTDAGSTGAFSSDGAIDSGDDVDPHTPVDVIATADNAYGFGWGDANATTTYIANPPSVVAGDIFNCPVGGPARKGTPLDPGVNAGPEAYTVPADDAPPGAYLYLVAWADFATTQGVIGQFKREGGSAVYTGARANGRHAQPEFLTTPRTTRRKTAPRKKSSINRLRFATRARATARRRARDG